MLGRMYELGDGAERNLDKARLYYQRASDGGNVVALAHLAALFIDEGKYLSGLVMKVKALIKAMLIRSKNPQDIRLKAS
jgi:TPR repeat protein